MRYIIAKSLRCMLVMVCTYLIPCSDVIADPFQPNVIPAEPAGCPTMRSFNERQLISLDDYDCIRYVTEAQISRDGKHVAYITQGQLHIRAVDTQNDWSPPNQTGESSWSPVWSNDSQTVFFLTGTGNITRVWKLTARPHESPTELICFGFTIDYLKLSSDGSRILLELNSPPTKLSNGMQKSNCLSSSTSEPHVISGMIFKNDTGYIQQRKRVFVVDLSTSDVRQVTYDAYSHGAANHDTESAWSYDGKAIAFVREYPARLRYESEIWITYPATTSTKKLTSTKGLRSLPLWSSDGNTIAYLHSESDKGPYAIQRLAIYSLKSGSERVLTRYLDRTVIAFRFSRDGKYLYFVYADRGAQHLARVRLADGDIDQLVRGQQKVTAIDLDERYRVIMIMNTMNDLPDLYLMDSGKSLTRLTDLNRAFLNSIEIAPKMKVQIRHPDGSTYEAFVTRHSDVKRSKSPAVLNLHGGPIDQQHTYGFSFFSQFLAAHGYVVVEPNVPGSLGRGQKVNLQILRNWGCVKYPKVLLALDQLVVRGIIDPKKLAVHGYSYGGYMTNCIITRKPKKFKAAASGGGHSFITANVGHDQWVKWYVWELGVPWKNRAIYDEISPLTRADRVRTPTLFLGGNQDWNAPIMNSELFYQALRIRGVKSQLIVYERGHRGWGRKLNKDYYSRVLGWFNDHMGK